MRFSSPTSGWRSLRDGFFRDPFFARLVGSFDRSTQSPFATGLLSSAVLWVSILINFLFAAAVLIVDTLLGFKSDAYFSSSGWT